MWEIVKSCDLNKTSSFTCAYSLVWRLNSEESFSPTTSNCLMRFTFSIDWLKQSRGLMLSAFLLWFRSIDTLYLRFILVVLVRCSIYLYTCPDWEVGSWWFQLREIDQTPHWYAPYHAASPDGAHSLASQCHEASWLLDGIQRNGLQQRQTWIVI